MGKDIIIMTIIISVVCVYCYYSYVASYLMMVVASSVHVHGHSVLNCADAFAELSSDGEWLSNTH